MKSRSLPAERCLAVLLDGELVRLFRVDDAGAQELRIGAPESQDGAAPVAAAPRNAGRADPHGGRRRHRDPDIPVLAGPACDHVHRTADRVAALVRHEHIDRILAGGAPECVAELTRILRVRLGGEVEAVSLPTGATADQVAQAARRARAEPATHEEEVLGDLIEAVGRGLAALGVAAVLDAVNDHSAAVLVLGTPVPTAGATCPRCGCLFASPVPGRCPACGDPLEPATDILTLAADLVRERGGTVEVIAAAAAAALASHEGVAALLRYAFPGAGRAAHREEAGAPA